MYDCIEDRGRLLSSACENPDMFIQTYKLRIKYSMCQTSIDMLLYPKRCLGGGGIFVSPCPSIFLSVCLSVCPSDSRLLTWCYKKWVHGFFRKLHITHHLKMCTWNFHIDWIIFLHFTGFFSVLRLSHFL